MATKLVKPSILGQPKEVYAIFFGEAPGKTEVDRGMAFVGRAGQLIRRLIGLELPGKNVILDNVCPEPVDGGIGKPTTALIKQYRPYVQRRIADYRPKVIVLLGEYALRSFQLKGTKPLRDCGKIITLDGLPPIVVSHHPAHALRSHGQSLGLYKRVFAAARLAPQQAKATQFTLVQDEAELQRVLKRTERKLCGFDLETTSLDPASGDILCAAIATQTERYCVPLAHPESPLSPDLGQVYLSRWFPKGPRVVHHAAFELAWMRSIGAENPARLHDTLVLAWLQDENQQKKLDHLVLSVLQKPPYWLSVDRTQGALTPLTQLAEYNVNDALCALELYFKLKSLLTPTVYRLEQELFVPLVKLMLTVKANGLHVDRGKLKKLRLTQERKLRLLLKKVDSVWPGLDVHSPKQVREALFTELGLLPDGLTPKGQPSTNDECLERLQNQDQRVALISQARKTSSLINRVLTPWLDLLDDDGLIHSTFSVCATTTGRLASSNPNVQNIDRGGPQRAAMVSRFKGGKIVQADYSQHELRVWAAVAGDTLFLDLFRGGVDVHQATCDAILAKGVPCTRSKAKNCNFAIIYDVTPKTLWERYSIPTVLGAELIATWDQLHPSRRKLFDRIEASMAEKGYVENVFGRRRHLTDPADAHQRKQGYNDPIQSAAAWICLLAMLKVQQWLELERMRSVIIAQVHDSIVLDCPAREVKKVAAQVRRIMLGVNYRRLTGRRLKHDIPLAVDVKVQEHF